MSANREQEHSLSSLVFSSSFSAHDFSKEQLLLKIELELLRNVDWDFDSNVTNDIFAILADSKEKKSVSYRKNFECSERTILIGRFEICIFERLLESRNPQTQPIAQIPGQQPEGHSGEGGADQLREESRIDDLQNQVGVHREPYERYFVLDSKKYLPLLIFDQPISFVHQIIMVHFVVFSVREGRVTRLDRALQR